MFLSSDLWANQDFRRLWLATTISRSGTMLGALSLTALVFLEASPSQLGLLTAFTSAPVLMFALFAGVWIDRLPRVVVMVIADVGRFGLLMTVPTAALLNALRIEQLYLVAFFVGSLEVVFRIGHRSILPTLLSREHLVDANSALRMSDAMADSVSPAVGGGLVQAVGGPAAVCIDAITFLASGLVIGRIRTATSGESAVRRSVLSDAFEGLRTVARHPLLRALVGLDGTYSFFAGFLLALYGFWVIQELEFSALIFGILMGAAGLGSLTGAALAGPFTRRLGLGPAVVGTYFGAAAMVFVIPFASGPAWAAPAMLVFEGTVGNALWAIHNIDARSLQQALTPDQQAGRVNAVLLLAGRGLTPVGALVAGTAAVAFGVQAMLFVAAAGINVAGLWLLVAKVWQLRDAETAR